MPPDTKKPGRDSKLRHMVAQHVSVLDKKKEPDDEPDHTIAHEDVRSALHRNRDYGDVALDRIRPDDDQVRKVDTQGAAFEELLASVRAHGVIHPITVRWIESDEIFQIITGERRYQAAKRAGLKTIPAIRRDIDDTTAAIHQVVENLQREDLNPLEEAAAYRRLMTATGKNQTEIAAQVGKSKAYISKVLTIDEGLTIEEKDLVRKVSTSKLSSRSLIYEALQTNNQKLRKAILSGDLTVMEARRVIKAATTDAPKKLSRRFQVAHPNAVVTVRVSGTAATEDDIRQALQWALAEQEKRLRGEEDDQEVSTSKLSKASKA